MTPDSPALPKRPGRRSSEGGVLPSGRRRAAASSVPDGARPEVAFSPEAPTRVSRPSPSKPAIRPGSSPRSEAQLAFSAKPSSGGDGHYVRREHGSSVPLERRVRSATRPCLCTLVGGPSEGEAARPDPDRSLYAVTVTNGVPAGGCNAVHPALQARGRATPDEAALP